jgi:hypothetical protein
MEGIICAMLNVYQMMKKAKRWSVVCEMQRRFEASRIKDGS